MEKSPRKEGKTGHNLAKQMGDGNNPVQSGRIKIRSKQDEGGGGFAGGHIRRETSTLPGRDRGVVLVKSCLQCKRNNNRGGKYCLRG